MTCLIRPLSEDDIDAICAIENASFSNPWTRKMFLAELNFQGFHFSRVAEDEASGQLVGYNFFWIVPEDEVQIANIAVHPDHRRQGIAQLLIDDAIQEGKVRNVTSVSLEVRESNLPARKFYEKLGFKQVGNRPNYYNHPKEDALILRLFFGDDLG